METMKNVPEGKGNMQNAPGKSSLPKGNVNDTGVKNGIGIPDVAGNKTNTSKQSGGNNRNTTFSNERPIF